MKELLQIGETALEKANCLDPRLDAELLMMYLLKLNKTQLFLKYPSVVDEKTCEGYFQLIDIRASGKPTQYITGEQEFMGLLFKVDENVLIPRQDTETLVEEVIEETKRIKTRGGYHILDLCCGSGAIGISLCKNINDAKVTAIDISKKAIEIAKGNALLNGVSKQIKFMESDLFSALKTGFGGSKFHMIVSNPPYIKSEVIPSLQREIVEHEPLIALDGGVDGLDFYRRIIMEAPLYLKKNAVLLMEIGHDQGDDLKSLIAESGKYKEPILIQDLTNMDRVMKCSVL